jgi:hypothetical protein
MTHFKKIALVSIIIVTPYIAGVTVTPVSVKNVITTMSPANIKAQFNKTKETLTYQKDVMSKKMAAMLLFTKKKWKGDSAEARHNRVQVYQWLQSKDWWLAHPKRWMKWIATGELTVKDVDNRIRDEEYVAYYVIYKEICLARELTQEEKEQARNEAMELLAAYKASRHID